MVHTIKNKRQILIIHGGMTFKKRADYLHFLKTREISTEKRRRWSDAFLDRALGNDFEIIRPRMPLSDNAKYEDWKIHFERYIPFLRNDVILIGSSLGGVFLAKYLSEHPFPKKILATYLICPPYDNSLPGEDLVGGFKLRPSLSRLKTNAGRLTLLFSEDDTVVPIAHAEKYRKKLPQAIFIIFRSKNGHFQISTFPEIVKMIRKDIRQHPLR